MHKKNTHLDPDSRELHGREREIERDVQPLSEKNGQAADDAEDDDDNCKKRIVYTLYTSLSLYIYIQSHKVYYTCKYAAIPCSVCCSNLGCRQVRNMALWQQEVWFQDVGPLPLATKALEREDHNLLEWDEWELFKAIDAVSISIPPFFWTTK